MTTVLASDGVKLYAESHGTGIPLILSGALCTTCENYRPQLKPLVEAGAQLILWDYRGHGRSESPDDPAAYSLDRVVDDLGRVLDWAAPGRAAVLGGLSFGGLASLHFAHRFPKRDHPINHHVTGPPEVADRDKAGRPRARYRPELALRARPTPRRAATAHQPGHRT